MQEKEKITTSVLFPDRFYVGNRNNRSCGTLQTILGAIWTGRKQHLTEVVR